jgi:hypothetical protein
MKLEDLDADSTSRVLSQLREIQETLLKVAIQWEERLIPYHKRRVDSNWRDEFRGLSFYVSDDCTTIYGNSDWRLTEFPVRALYDMEGAWQEYVESEENKKVKSAQIKIEQDLRKRDELIYKYGLPEGLRNNG